MSFLKMLHVNNLAILRSDDSYGCDKVICSTTCEFGFKLDRQGCPTCDCVESPCETFYKCPESSKCEMVSDPTCLKNECPMRPTCLSQSLFVNPCPLGTPLTDMSSGQVVACSESASTCPSSHICVIVSPNQAGLCCANRPRVGKLFSIHSQKPSLQLIQFFCWSKNERTAYQRVCYVAVLSVHNRSLVRFKLQKHITFFCSGDYRAYKRWNVSVFDSFLV